MNSITKIAKITLEKIFHRMYKGHGKYILIFSDDEIDLHKEVDCSDPRDGNGNEPDDYQYFSYCIWGLELGFRELHNMSLGKKELLDRIVEVEARGLWEEYREGFTFFSHIIEINNSGETGLNWNGEITVYKVTEKQRRELITKS